MGQNGLDWLCYLAGNFQTAPTIFFIFSGYFFLNDFIKNPQTRNARAFLPLIISAVGSVNMIWSFLVLRSNIWILSTCRCNGLPYNLSKKSMVDENCNKYDEKGERNMYEYMNYRHNWILGKKYQSRTVSIKKANWGELGIQIRNK